MRRAFSYSPFELFMTACFETMVLTLAVRFSSQLSCGVLEIQVFVWVT